MSTDLQIDALGSAKNIDDVELSIRVLKSPSVPL